MCFYRIRGCVNTRYQRPTLFNLGGRPFDAVETTTLHVTDVTPGGHCFPRADLLPWRWGGHLVSGVRLAHRGRMAR